MDLFLLRTISDTAIFLVGIFYFLSILKLIQHGKVKLPAPIWKLLPSAHRNKKAKVWAWLSIAALIVLVVALIFRGSN
ncbi:MAG: hypothetical protein COB22_07360 [Cycloclasticus sp.]|nr:MAG: hypothetical protein COB22_07360 [Cycloclasticus sp.]